MCAKFTNETVVVTGDFNYYNGDKEQSAVALEVDVRDIICCFVSQRKTC